MTQYERLAINQQSLDNIVASSKEALAVKKAKVDDLARKIKQSAKIESLIAQSKRLRQELAWAYVIEKEQASVACFARHSQDRHAPRPKKTLMSCKRR
jgi:hypothetical protein